MGNGKGYRFEYNLQGALILLVFCSDIFYSVSSFNGQCQLNPHPCVDVKAMDIPVVEPKIVGINSSIPKCCEESRQLILNDIQHSHHNYSSFGVNATIRTLQSTEVNNCSQNFLINYPDHKIFRILDDGDVQVGLDILVDYPYPVWMAAEFDSFCIKSSLDSACETKSNATGNQTDFENYDILLYCSISLLRFDTYMFHRQIHGVIKIIQGLLSLLTTLPYLVLWKVQNTTGWVQFSFFVSLGMDCLLCGIYNFIYENELSLKSPMFCHTTAAFIQIFEIACYSTWATGHYDMLRIVWTSDRMMCKSSIEKRRLAIYTFTGWGLPIGVVTFGAIWNHVYNGDYFEKGRQSSDESQRRCLPPVSTSVPTFIVQVGFLAASLIFFSTMAIVIRKRQNDTRLASKTLKKRYGRQMKTFLKLTIFLGLPFVIISVIELSIGEVIAGSWVLIIFRLLLLGTVIFACHAFGYNRRNRSLLTQQYNLRG